MKTLGQLSLSPKMLPATAVWYLTYLAEAKGKQALFMKQVPQRLKVLKEHAIVESAISSNRIEGIEVENKRVRDVVLGRSHLKDRDEEEVRGYRNALDLIHNQGDKLPVSKEMVCELHRFARGNIWDAGKFRDKQSDIIETYPDGRSRIRFRTVHASSIPGYLQQLNSMWHDALEQEWVQPMIVLAAYNLDFLCIHPFRDGNGRVSRLLMLLQTYHLGYEVGRYISIERLIEENKERYYETLELSSRNWHEGKHDPWPYINFVLYILKSACIEFEERLDRLKIPRGSKTQLIRDAVMEKQGQFTLADIERACPEVSRDMIRRVLRLLKDEGYVECLGKGPGAPWQKRGNTLKRGE